MADTFQTRRCDPFDEKTSKFDISLFADFRLCDAQLLSEADTFEDVLQLLVRCSNTYPRWFVRMARAFWYRYPSCR